MSRQARRHRRHPAGVRQAEPKPRPSYAERRGKRNRTGGRRWLVPLLAAAAVAVIALVAVNLWLQSRPAQPDDAAVHADIVAGRSGAEVTLNATVLQAPSRVGNHEHIEVSDAAGDHLELDYNLDLGRWVPLQPAQRILVHGQLYVDPGGAGIHCLHSVTSSGCPYPGWVKAAGTTYS